MEKALSESYVLVKVYGVPPFIVDEGELQSWSKRVLEIHINIYNIPNKTNPW